MHNQRLVKQCRQGQKMNKSAILHIPMSEYAYALDESHVVFRLRTAREDIEKCYLYYGDRACRHTPVPFTQVQMELVAQSDLFDYYEVKLNSPYQRVCYYFHLESKGESTLYYGDMFMDECVDDRCEYYQFPFIHRADIITLPKWTEQAVVYNIFPDSFASDRRYISGEGEEISYKGTTVRGKHGGTIYGIMKNVDYFLELGINVVYLNPIFAAGEYHKYDLVDYFHIDPCFGTDDDFKKLVQVLHENNIKIIIDGVFNHCGWNFFAFDDVVENGENSIYKDWFYDLTFPVIKPDSWEEYPNYSCFAYERKMPKLNTNHPQLMEYFGKVCKHWITEFQIDGWRLDVANEVNDDFWRMFYKAAKEEKADILIIGEVWESANHWLEKGIFDSAMNYDLRKHTRRFFAEEEIDAAEFDARVTNMRMRYREQTAMAQLNLLDSHDVSRFLSLCQGDRGKLELAVLFQMTFIGMPCIFYGDEQGIEGMKEDDYRQPMYWKDNNRLFDFYQKVISLRKSHKSMQSGGFRTIKADKNSKVYIYERYLEEEVIRIILNMEYDDIGMEDIQEEQVLLEKERAGNRLGPKGFVVYSIKNK